MNLEQLLDQVKTEVVHLTNVTSPDNDTFRQQVAISLLARIPVLLSPAIYSSLLAGGVAPRGVENTLALGAGICGNHVQLAMSLLKSLGVPARDIQVFYTDGDLALNHTVVEVRWADEWRMVDFTWGFIPHRGSLDSALSFEQASQTGHREGFHHSVIPWRRAVESEYDIFGYLQTDPDALYVDGEGYARLRTGAGAVEIPHPAVARAGNWSHIGNAIGSGRIEIEVPDGRWSYVLSGTTTQEGHLEVDGRALDLPAGESEIELIIEGPRLAVVEFRGKAGTGYLKVAEIEAASLAKPARRGVRLLRVDAGGQDPPAST